MPVSFAFERGGSESIFYDAESDYGQQDALRAQKRCRPFEELSEIS